MANHSASASEQDSPPVNLFEFCPKSDGWHLVCANGNGGAHTDERGSPTECKPPVNSMDRQSIGKAGSVFVARGGRHLLTYDDASLWLWTANSQAARPSHSLLRLGMQTTAFWQPTARSSRRCVLYFLVGVTKPRRSMNPKQFRGRLLVRWACRTEECWATNPQFR